MKTCEKYCEICAQKNLFARRKEGIFFLSFLLRVRGCEIYILSEKEAILAQTTVEKR